MVRSTWEELTAPLSASDLELFETYRAFCLALPGTEERVHTTEVHFAVERIYTSGYLKSHHLELAIDLLREIDGEHLRAAFRTTKAVITHRFTIDSLKEFETVEDAIREAHETVGPGLR
jgi:hypothetical protein